MILDGITILQRLAEEVIFLNHRYEINQEIPLLERAGKIPPKMFQSSFLPSKFWMSKNDGRS